METNEPRPTPAQAAEDLAALADAQRVVRDQPWPVWLYPVNTTLLVGITLAGLLETSALRAILVLAGAMAIAGLNYWAGRLIGAPYTIPTNRAFRWLVALAAAFVIVSLAARDAGTAWLIVLCAIGAGVSYAVASVLHYRSTRR